MDKTKGQELFDKLSYTPLNTCAELSESELKKVDDWCEGYKAYLDSSKTEREAVDSAVELLEKDGFVEFDRSKKYKAGDRVYYNNRGKALVIATIGTEPIDAVCINAKVAERLSGADFDGDTVMCIPTNNGKGKITSTPPLKGLEGFDPKTEYGPDTYAGRNITYMTKANTQKQMGVISNLITDMTLAGANQDELAAAVRHSMVVIDAEKHNLDYKASEADNGIKALKEAFKSQSMISEKEPANS